jgi:hypothetical protein
MKSGIAFGGLFMLSVLLLSNLTISVNAQGNPTATPAVATANPTIAVLENTIATQQIQINQLNTRLTDEERERKYYDRDIFWKWGISAALATAVISILTWVGRKSLQDLQNDWQRDSQKILDKAIYKLDLSNLPIYLPSGENLENIHRLLQLRKFEKVGFYKTLGEFEHGVLIVSLKGKDDKQQAEILDKFKDFIDSQNPSAANTGFIIYAPAGIRVPPEIMECHDNLVTANYPATVVSSIFTVGRGIEIPVLNA